MLLFWPIFILIELVKNHSIRSYQKFSKIIKAVLRCINIFYLATPQYFNFRHKDVEFVIPGSKRMSTSTTCLYQGTYNGPSSNSRRNSQARINVSSN